MGDIWGLNGKSSRPNKKSNHNLNKSQKGFIGEYKAIIDLTKQGYHVAKAVDPQCPFDLVAVDKNGNVRLIDVKSNSYRKKNNWRINRGLSDKQKKLKIELLMIDHEK